MNIVLYMDSFKDDYINFLDTKENMITNGHFTKIIYSNSVFSMNGLYFFFPIDIKEINHNYNKTFVKFDIYQDINNKIIRYLSDIESSLLRLYDTGKNKIHKPIFNQQLRSGYVKIHTKGVLNKNSKFIVKLSGLWENNNEIGITYKIINITTDYSL
jgi:hypothetical protein